MGFRNLEIYNKAFRLALEIHGQTMTFPKMENYELGTQLRKAAKSVCLNIAEGYGRKSYERDFAKFLVNALGSANETQVCLDFALSLGYLDDKKHNYFTSEYDLLGKQTNTFISRLKQSDTNSQKLRTKS